MKKLLWQYLPILGALLVVLLLAGFRPAFIHTDMAWLVLLGVPSFTWAVSFVIILASLPGDAVVTVLKSKRLTPELTQMVRQFEALGFRQIGEPQRVELGPAVEMVGLIHEQTATLGRIWRVENARGKVTCDLQCLLSCDSLLVEREGTLTTCREPGQAYLPVTRGSFMQVFPEMSLQDMFDAHLQTLAFLDEQGFMVVPAVPGDLVPVLKRGMLQQRATFLRRPIWHTFLMVWRAGLRRTPYLGAVEQQKLARRVMARVKAELVARPI